MSTTLLFRNKFLRYNVIIQHCFSLQRKSKLLALVQNGPWANGLTRLLAERRGLTKGKLAELIAGDVGKKARPAMISKVAKGHTDKFQMTALVQLAEAFSKYDRLLNPQAPDVELWEFFVSDEQAAALRARAIKTRAESADETLLARAAEMFAASLKQARAEQSAPPAEPTIVEAARKKSGKR